MSSEINIKLSIIMKSSPRVIGMQISVQVKRKLVNTNGSSYGNLNFKFIIKDVVTIIPLFTPCN